jgi:hypothetical protein
MSELELQLYAIMVKLVVRYPDGVTKIEQALQAVIKAGQEMASECPGVRDDVTYH